jgi:hypothetical protein
MENTKIVQIEQVEFPFDIGVKILKYKHKDTDKFKELEGLWEDVEPLTFQDALRLRNIEQRRIAINTLGIEEVVKNLDAELISRETIHKTTMYINAEGDLVNREFDDTYELYEIPSEILFADAETEGRRTFTRNSNYHFVKCRCTSTDREYLIWVDIDQIYSANGIGWGKDREKKKPNSIQAIAWTIQTDIPKGKIEKIIRQGDCIFVKPLPQYYEEESKWRSVRHLTEKEYRELLVAES